MNLNDSSNDTLSKETKAYQVLQKIGGIFAIVLSVGFVIVLIVFTVQTLMDRSANDVQNTGADVFVEAPERDVPFVDERFVQEVVDPSVLPQCPYEGGCNYDQLPFRTYEGVVVRLDAEQLIVEDSAEGLKAYALADTVEMYTAQVVGSAPQSATREDFVAGDMVSFSVMLDTDTVTRMTRYEAADTPGDEL